MSLRKAELDQQLHGGLRFVDEQSIVKLQDGWTFKAKPGLTTIQFALLFQKVRYLGGSYNNVTRSFTVDTRLDTVQSQPSASCILGNPAVDNPLETFNLFQRIESQLAVSGETLDTVAKKLGVGRATVARAKRIIQSAPKEILRDCRDDKCTINAAYHALK